MSLLSKNTLPCERRIGCSFADQFRSESEVEANGGSVTGNPVLSEIGVELDGNDYITYNLTGREFNSDPISILIEFTPDFNTDQNSERVLFDAADAGAKKYRVLKGNNASNNVLSIALGNTYIANVAEATYSPYWLTDARNVLVVSGTTGDTSAWLNGNMILANDATAWTAADPISCVIGAYWNGTAPFDGTIHSVRVFKAKLTKQDAINFYLGTTYDYFRPRSRTFEESFSSQASVESHFGVVYGTPTFGNTGVILNGSTDYLKFNLRGDELFKNKISFAVEFTPDFDYDYNGKVFLFDTNATGRCHVWKEDNAGGNNLIIRLGDTAIASIVPATYSPYWNANGRNVLVVSGSDGDTDAWLNGNAILTNDSTSWSASTPTTLYVGCNNANNYLFDGTIHSFHVYPFLVTSGEALAMYSSGTFNISRPRGAIYQMKMEDHDPTGNQTLDSGGGGYHLTDVSDPVKLVRRGYDFDGTNDYFKRTSDGTFNPSGDFSVVAFIRPDTVAAGTDIIICKNKPTGNQRSWRLMRGTANILFGVSDDGTADGGHWSELTVTSCLSANSPSVVVATYDYVADGTSIATVYVDDFTPGKDTTFDGPPYASTGEFTLGADGDYGNPWDGDILFTAFFDDLVLTPLQVEDLKVKLWKQLQDV